MWPGGLRACHPPRAHDLTNRLTGGAEKRIVEGFFMWPGGLVSSSRDGLATAT
jgi:hypothetical protein